MTFLSTEEPNKESNLDFLLTDLSLLLEQEQDLHQQLLKHLEGEAEGFGVASGSTMWHFQVNKDQCVQRIQRLEEKRIEVTEQLASLWDTSVEDLTLSIIIAKVSAETGQGLQQCFDALKSLISEIQTLSEQNATDSSSRLKSIEQSMRFINEYNTEQTYSDSGTLKNTTKVLRTSI